MRKVIEVCDERLKQLEDHIVTLGSDVPHPLSLQSEALLLEIRTGARAGESSANNQEQDQDQDQDPDLNPIHLQDPVPVTLAQTDFPSGHPHVLQPQSRYDEALWDSGQDASPQWPIRAPQPAQAIQANADMGISYMTDYPMALPNATDLLWNGSHEDAFLQSITAVDPSFMEMPLDMVDMSSPSWDALALSDDIQGTTDDDSDNEIVEQLSVRLGDLYLADDGTFRYLGATSNMTLAQHWSFREAAVRQRPQKQVDNTVSVPELDESLNLHLENLYFCWQEPFLNIVDREVFNQSKKQTQTGGKNSFYSEALKFAMYGYH